MHETADKELLAVYNRLRDRYPLVLTTTAALDQGFTVDCPIIVGEAHERIVWLYMEGGRFILEVMDSCQTAGTHWHPPDVDDAVNDITELMEGQADYELIPFGQQ